MAKAAARSKVVVRLFVNVTLFYVPPIVCVCVLVWSMFCFALFSVPSSFMRRSRKLCQRGSNFDKVF